MKQESLFEEREGTDAGVPLVRVKSSIRRGGAWICLLECGHEAQVPCGPRPKHVPHECAAKEQRE